MSASFLTIWTLALAAAIVAVLAIYLVGVVVQLHRASRNLQKLAGGLLLVRTNAQPLEERLATIAGALSALAEAFHRVEENLSATAKSLGD